MVKNLLLFFGVFLSSALIGFLLGLLISAFMNFESGQELVFNYIWAALLSAIFAIYASSVFLKGLWEKRKNSDGN